MRRLPSGRFHRTHLTGSDDKVGQRTYCMPNLAGLYPERGADDL